MRIFPTDQHRGAILNRAQPDRPWRSLDEQRRCVICDKTFTGREVVIRWSRHGVRRLSCPQCESGPALWVRMGNPLIDEDVWMEWEAVLAQAASGDGEWSVAV
jgi:hypothetical protein